MSFHPLGPSLFVEAGPEPVVAALPLPLDVGARKWSYCAARLAAASETPDILVAFGGEDVTVDPDSALLYLAGTMETIGIGAATHIAVMTASSDAATGRLNITIGVGD